MNRIVKVCGMRHAENIRQVVSEICKDCGKLYFIPCTTQGGPASIYPGVYDTVNEEIDFATKSLF